MVQNKIRKSRKEISTFSELKNNTAKIKFSNFDDNEENNSNDYDNCIQKQEEANEKHLDYFEDYEEEDGNGYKKDSKYKNKKTTNISYKSKADRGSSNSATNYKSYNQDKNYDYSSNGNRYFNSSKNRSENNYNKKDNESSYNKRGNSYSQNQTWRKR